MGILIIKIRQSHDCLFFVVGIPVSKKFFIFRRDPDCTCIWHTTPSPVLCCPCLACCLLYSWCLLWQSCVLDCVVYGSQDADSIASSLICRPTSTSVREMSVGVWGNLPRILISFVARLLVNSIMWNSIRMFHVLKLQEKMQEKNARKSTAHKHEIKKTLVL